MLLNKFFGKKLVSRKGVNSVNYFSRRVCSFLGKLPSGEDVEVMQFIRNAMEAVPNLGGDTFFSDGMIVWGRVLGWLGSQKFIDAINESAPSSDDAGRDSAIVWRSHVACWAASIACKSNGDFFEFGCYEGYTALLIRAYLKNIYFDNNQARKYFWFDRFSGGGPQKTVPLSHKNSYERAFKRSLNYDDIILIKGDLSYTYLSQDVFRSRKVAFAHFDTNNFKLEKDLLVEVYKNSGPGSVFLFDDFAMMPFRKQNEFYSKFFEDKGHEILSLPTGQGVVLL